ncbi:MAG: TonB-dependent receptor, partial [Pedobacter sp.]
DITLLEELSKLNEVVVTAYGVEKKKDLTGAVSTIQGEEVSGRKTVKISDALQGAMPGVSVTRSSGTPGSGSTILIRGVTTLGTNAPLFIVDGVAVSNIDNVNPNDVESISVLKDAASAAIYGSRAAAGVVLISTKRAKEGQSSFDYNYEYGIQTPTALPEYAGIIEYMNYFNEFLKNDGGTELYPKATINSYLENNIKNPDLYPITNWQDVVIGDYAPRQRHDLSFTIGTGKIKTLASLGYSLSEGLYDNLSYDQYQFRINNDLKVNDKLDVNLDVFYRRSNSQAPVDGGNSILFSRLFPAYLDDYYSDGRKAPGKDGANPIVQIREGGFSKNVGNQIGGRMAFNLKPVKGLTLSALVSPTFDIDQGKSFSKVISYTALDDPGRIIAVNQPRTNLTESRPYNFYINGQLLANYSTNIRGLHQIDVLGGYEENYYYTEAISASRSGFDVTSFPFLNIGSLEFRDNGGSASESALRSLFSRVKYNFKNKYYIQGNLRYDQSSRFHPDYRNSLFPSFSAGWTLTEESFLKNIKPLSFLKIRGSWGIAGNERIGNYPYQSTIQFSNALFYQNGKVVTKATGAQNAYAVEDISWENTRSIDLGLDATFFNNKLSITADYFYKRTTDILLTLDIPNYIGYTNPFQNAGVVDAKGWEVATGWNDRAGELKYSIGLNLSDAKTRIVDLKGTQILGNQAKLEGGQFNEWYGYRSAGLFQTSEEVKSSPVLNANMKPGDVKYIDVNGDGKITAEGDKVLLGGSMPRYTFGGNIGLDYKGFDFSIVFQGVGKIKSQLNNMQVQPFLNNYGNVPMEIVNKFWSPNNSAEQNLAARYPRFSRTSDSNNYQMSDFWLYNGAYFRMKNISIGYTIKSRAIQKLGLQSVQLYVA